MSDDTNVALSVMDLENGFRNDEIVIRLHAQLLQIVGASTAPTSMARAGGGAVHSINGDIRLIVRSAVAGRVAQHGDGIGGQISAPSNDLIGANQYQIGLIEVAGLIASYGGHAQRNIQRLCRSLERRGGAPFAELQQGELEAERIVKRAPICKPQMGRPTARTCSRHIVVRSIRRRRGAIVNNNRRAVVATTEGDARNVEFEARMIIQMIAGPLARGFTGGAVFFQFRRWNE